MQYLTIWDLILTPIYLVVLTAIAVKQRDKRYPIGHPLRTYYLPGLFVKFGGAIFIALIYQYYYNGGDTYNYYEHSQVINTALNDSVVRWFKLVINTPMEHDPSLYRYISRMWWYDDPNEYTVAAIGAVFGVLNGTSYIPIALLFAYFSFTGIWAMFRTFCNIYPTLHKQLAIAFLFIPSTFVWGSAMFKDTVCMFGLGWLTYTVFRIFINKDFSGKNLFLLVISFFLVYKTKVYILLSFIPALSIWLLTMYSSQIRSAGLRTAAKTAFIAAAIGAFLLFANKFADELQRYSLERIAQTAATTRDWLTIASGDEGSTYDLGAFEPTIGGMIKKFPQAVVVTLFRPFPWEARKVIVLLSALEALVFASFTFLAFKRRGPGKAFKLIGKDPNLFFFLIFSLIFAFAVGISSYNFGALSRYKIPCLPFYAALLVVLMYKDKLPAKGTTKSYLPRHAQPAAM